MYFNSLKCRKTGTCYILYISNSKWIVSMCYLKIKINKPIKNRIRVCWNRTCLRQEHTMFQIWCHKDGPCINGLIWCRNVQVEKIKYSKFYQVWHLNTRSILTTLIKYSVFVEMDVGTFFMWYVSNILLFPNDDIFIM